MWAVYVSVEASRCSVTAPHPSFEKVPSSCYPRADLVSRGGGCHSGLHTSSAVLLLPMLTLTFGKFFVYEYS